MRAFGTVIDWKIMPLKFWPFTFLRRKPIRKNVLFYDANCFSTICRKDIKLLIKNNHNFVTSSVADEIKKGKEKLPSSNAFNLVLNSNNKISKNFKEVVLNYCDKNRKAVLNLSDKQINLKENPLLCSAYYTWLGAAINPAIPTDSYRYWYNEILRQSKGNTPQQVKDDLSKTEQRLRQREILSNETHDAKTGHGRAIKWSWLLKARKKRLDEVKDNHIKLSDAQTLITAMLFACYLGRPAMIVTCDRDFLDLLDNLFESIIEKFTVTKILTERINDLSEKQMEIYNDKGMDIDISLKELIEQVKVTVNRIANEKKFIRLILLLYKKNVNKAFDYVQIIPLWLRDFILEFKHNLDCYSISAEQEVRYNFKYIYKIVDNFTAVKYHISPRTRPPLMMKACWPHCEKNCRYAKQEKENPVNISEFIKEED